jgi:hypothetical protein
MPPAIERVKRVADRADGQGRAAVTGLRDAGLDEAIEGAWRDQGAGKWLESGRPKRPAS